MADPRGFLAFAHIGDLHVSNRDPGHLERLRSAVAQIGDTGDALAFAFVPGDNADNGLPEQYAQVRSVLDRLAIPVHVITGDHDMEGGSLDAFYAGLGARHLPYAIDAGGMRCLFLDMAGPGTGGPDFRLGVDQIDWLSKELREAEARGQLCAVFMHSYPADLRGGEADAVADLLHRGPVRLVEMGHTHYNELSNDGRTIYAATRSIGQIEEGPPGYAIVAIDGGVVSWRFKALAAPWPFVLVTSPADRRLAHDAAHVAGEAAVVRALVLGPDVKGCDVSADEGPWQPMRQSARTAGWESLGPVAGIRLRVRAVAAGGTADVDAIERATGPDDIPTSKGIGSDSDTLGAWEAKGLLGTQLGPNRNGRKW
jgi:3',5'-cyclic-AMP phosphodiesterase